LVVGCEIYSFQFIELSICLSTKVKYCNVNNKNK